jgi:hypothetical protein
MVSQEGRGMRVGVLVHYTVFGIMRKLGAARVGDG